MNKDLYSAIDINEYPVQGYSSECCNASPYSEITIENGDAWGRCSACKENALFFSITEEETYE